MDPGFSPGKHIIYCRQLPDQDTSHTTTCNEVYDDDALPRAADRDRLAAHLGIMHQAGTVSRVRRRCHHLGKSGSLQGGVIVVGGTAEGSE
jgi:hypothetical protein